VSGSGGNMLHFKEREAVADYSFFSNDSQGKFKGKLLDQNNNCVESEWASHSNNLYGCKIFS